MLNGKATTLKFLFFQIRLHRKLAISFLMSVVQLLQIIHGSIIRLIYNKRVSLSLWDESKSGGHAEKGRQPQLSAKTANFDAVYLTYVGHVFMNGVV